MGAFPQRLSPCGFVLVLVLAAVSCTTDRVEAPSRVEAAFNSLDRFQDGVIRSYPSTQTAASKIHDRYRQLFSKYQTNAAVAQLGPDDVAILFRAAHLDFFYTISRASLDDMQLDLAELHRRKVARKGDDERVLAALIESRLFEKARAFRKLHPLAAAQTVPEITTAELLDGPTTLLVKNDGKKLVRRSVDIRKGSLIVVVSSPLCHFSPRAIRSIEGDALLRPLVLGHARWIVPPDESTSFSTVAKWNQLHPHEQMEFAYRREEWPMVERWETPVFYFFKNGRVVSKVTGWPVAGRKPEIRRSLRLTGLM